MNRRLLAALAAGTLFANSAAVLAQVPAAPPPPPAAGHSFFDEMDSNKDGVVTRAEVTAVLDRRFAALDINQDGIISQTERQAHRQAQRDRRFAERFAALDTDHNGQLNPVELRAADDRRVGRDRDTDSPPPRGPAFSDALAFGGRGHGGWKYGPGNTHESVSRNRRNSASEITPLTKAAFSKRTLAIFDLLDSNDDGKITAAERDAAPNHRDFSGNPDGGHRTDGPKS